MLHVANGDALAEGLRAARVGPVVAWREMMSDGPIPNHLRGEADWRERAAWLARDYPLDPAAYVADAAARLQRVAAEAHAGPVTLWFDPELFCQANLCHLVDWLAREAPDAELLLVPESRDPKADLAALARNAVPLERPRRALARAFWNALASPDASGLERLARVDLSLWPEFAIGLRAQIARFPDTTGRSAIEAEMARLRAQGATSLPELFRRWQATPLGQACGFGDTQVALALRNLDAPPSERWIGGVHLAPGRPGWRREGSRLVRA